MLRRVNAGGSLRQRIINSMSGMLGKDQARYASWTPPKHPLFWLLLLVNVVKLSRSTVFFGNMKGHLGYLVELPFVSTGSGQHTFHRNILHLLRRNKPRRLGSYLL